MPISFIVKKSTPPEILNGLKDYSIYDRTVQGHGNYTWDSVSKKFGITSLNLSGDASLSSPYNSNLNLGTIFTISMWVNYTSGDVSGQQAILLQYYTYEEGEGGTKAGGYQVYIAGASNTYNEGSIRFDYWPPEEGAKIMGFDYSSTEGSPIADLGWVHIAVVRNGSTGYLFIDGTSVGSFTGTGSGVHNTPIHDLRIGRNSQNATLYFKGGIDEVLILDGVALWTSNFTPPDSPYTGTGPAGTRLLMHMDDNQ